MNKYAKFLRSDLVSISPLNTALVDGRWVGNVQADPEAMRKLGWKPLVEAPRPIGHYRAVYVEGKAEITQSWEAYTPEPVIVNIPKLRLLRLLRAAGTEAKFMTALDTLHYLADWDVLPFVSSDDPALAQTLAATGMRSSAIATLMEAAVVEDGDTDQHMQASAPTLEVGKI